MKRNKIIFYIATVLLSVIVLFSVWMYIFKHDMIVGSFTHLGYPPYLIYPYAGLKLLGLFAIWNPNFNVIKEWAYSAFFFAFVLALSSHLMVNDGGHTVALMALVLLIISYIFKQTNK
ncbi:DoxX family protein [Algibacter miyuki]|uniref:DoxX family protein n=1 Tax=Algibacter miyuki TaxID=1306933 RepID=A0ABV5GYT5_9FLAO|nr:DoxX family protein [Algibacter miyuki]MDN3667006.1 DoxX family protein [Algibacter miyuki]